MTSQTIPIKTNSCNFADSHINIWRHQQFTRICHICRGKTKYGAKIVYKQCTIQLKRRFCSTPCTKDFGEILHIDWLTSENVSSNLPPKYSAILFAVMPSTSRYVFSKPPLVIPLLFIIYFLQLYFYFT